MKSLIRLFAVLMLLVCKAVLADVTFVHTDALGSPVAETNSAGQLVRLSHYKPFGEELEQKKDDIAYTGHKYDAALELIYMQARYYDPVIGRFYSNDPVDFQGHLNRGNATHGFNRYTYANNNPYKYTDPDGKFAFVIPLIIPFVGGTTMTVSPVVVASGVAAGAVLTMSGDSDSSKSEIRGKNGRSTDNPVDLAEDLAGQEILGDFSEGGGKNMSDKMGDTNRYGPNGTHDKVVGSKTHSDGTKTEVHGDRNRETGELSDTKFKDPPDNSKSRNQ